MRLGSRSREEPLNPPPPPHQRDAGVIKNHTVDQLSLTRVNIWRQDRFPSVERSNRFLKVSCFFRVGPVDSSGPQTKRCLVLIVGCGKFLLSVDGLVSLGGFELLLQERAESLHDHSSFVIRVWARYTRRVSTVQLIADDLHSRRRPVYSNTRGEDESISPAARCRRNNNQIFELRLFYSQRSRKNQRGSSMG